MFLAAGGSLGGQIFVVRSGSAFSSPIPRNRTPVVVQQFFEIPIAVQPIYEIIHNPSNIKFVAELKQDLELTQYYLEILKTKAKLIHVYK